MTWSTTAVYDDTLILGNTFSNNSAIAGGIIFQAGLNSASSIVLIDRYWPDMLHAQEGERGLRRSIDNTAFYGPVVAGVLKTLICGITALNGSVCPNASSNATDQSGNFYNDESLYISETKVTCCLFDIFDQPVTDRRRCTSLTKYLPNPISNANSNSNACARTRSSSVLTSTRITTVSSSVISLISGASGFFT